MSKRYGNNSNPSVTEIIDLCNSFDVTWWAKSVRKKLLAAGEDLNKIDPLDVCHVLKEESARAGNRIHKGLEKYCLGKADYLEGLQDEDEIIRVNHVVKWFGEVDFQPLEPERKLINLKRKYNGTVDCIGKIEKKLVMLDHKSGNAEVMKKNKYRKERLQLAGYAISYQDLYKKKITEGWILGVPKDLTFHPQKIEITKADKEAFLQLRELYRYMKGK